MTTFEQVVARRTEEIAGIAGELNERLNNGPVDVDEMVEDFDHVASIADDLARRVTEAQKTLEGQEGEEGQQQGQQNPQGQQGEQGRQGGDGSQGQSEGSGRRSGRQQSGQEEQQG